MRNGVIRPDAAVGPDLEHKLVVVRFLSYAGVLHLEIYFANRGKYGINRDNTDRLPRLFIFIRGDIAPAAAGPHFKLEFPVFIDRRQMEVRVQNLHLCVRLDILCRNLSRAFRLQREAS